MNASTAETTFMRAVLWLFNFDDYVTIFYNNEWYLEHTTLSSFYADLDEQLIDLEKKTVEYRMTEVETEMQPYKISCEYVNDDHGQQR